MSAQVQFRNIRPSDCSEVARLHLAVFPASDIRYTIYGCEGITRYLQALTRLEGIRTADVLLGAWEGDILVGYAHCKALTDTWHLNYIAVRPEYRGHKIGKELMRRWVKMGKGRSYKEVSLDVAHDNDQAIAWYRRSGLVETERQHIYSTTVTAPVSGQINTEGLEVMDWESAEAWQIAYGFSRFRVRYGEQCWTVGRLGNEFFRVTQRLEPPLEKALFQLDASRQVLVASSYEIPNPSYKKVGSSIRMCGNLDEALRRCP